MNIFVVDKDHTVSAKALDDLRLNKMILETAQLLSTAMNERGYDGRWGAVYKTTHVNHPCSVWARETRTNYVWLLDYFHALYMERVARTGKGHKSYDRYNSIFNKGITFMPIADLTPFANCTPHKDMEVHEAYKLTLKEKWAQDKRPPTWQNAWKPDWA